MHIERNLFYTFGKDSCCIRDILTEGILVHSCAGLLVITLQLHLKPHLQTELFDNQIWAKQFLQKERKIIKNEHNKFCNISFPWKCYWFLGKHRWKLLRATVGSRQRWRYVTCARGGGKVIGGRAFIFQIFKIRVWTISWRSTRLGRLNLDISCCRHVDGSGSGSTAAGAVTSWCHILEAIFPVLIRISCSVVCRIGEIFAGVSPVSTLFLFACTCHQPFFRLSLDQRARVSLWLPVERHEWNGQCDAGEEEEVTPADARPEAVERVNDFVADGDDGGVVATAQRLASSDVILRHVDHSFDVDVNLGIENMVSTWM